MNKTRHHISHIKNEPLNTIDPIGYDIFFHFFFNERSPRFVASGSEDALDGTKVMLVQGARYELQTAEPEEQRVRCSLDLKTKFQEDPRRSFPPKKKGLNISGMFIETS